MNIEYLQALRDNPIVYEYKNEGISVDEIQRLEQLYNNGKPFPKVLKELLYLAGNFCGYLDQGYFDSQQEAQDEMRSELADRGIVIARPHFFIDFRTYDYPMFIHLDEGDNPLLYQLKRGDTSTKYGGNALNGRRTIKWLLERAIDGYREGYGPM